MLTEAMTNNLTPEETIKYCLEGKPQADLYSLMDDLQKTAVDNSESTEDILDAVDDLSSDLEKLSVTAKTTGKDQKLGDYDQILSELVDDLKEIRQKVVALTE